MGKKLTNNLKLKILSVFLAFFVWLAVTNISNPDVTATKEVPLEVLNEDVLSTNGKTYELIDNRTTVTVAYKVRTPVSYTHLLCTFFLRALPFLAFGGSQKMPDWLDRLGKTLPSAIMAVLIVYCLKDVGSDVVHIGLPKIAAVVIVALSYKLKHNTLVSIAVGTAGYMILLRVAAML